MVLPFTSLTISLLVNSFGLGSKIFEPLNRIFKIGRIYAEPLRQRGNAIRIFLPIISKMFNPLIGSIIKRAPSVAAWTFPHLLFQAFPFYLRCFVPRIVFPVVVGFIGIFGSSVTVTVSGAAFVSRIIGSVTIIAAVSVSRCR